MRKRLYRLAGDLDHAKGEPEKTKNANGSGISFRQKIAEIKLSAYAPETCF
jgi:hypothetical protein